MACVYDTLGIDSSTSSSSLLFDPLELLTLSKTRSDYVSSAMYMLVSLVDYAGYVLYRIDPLYHLQHNNNNNNNNSEYLNDLQPLLVFPGAGYRTSQDIDCIKFGSKLYFFGLEHYSGSFRIRTKTTNVYSIEEDVLVGIKPSEHNHVNKFKDFFTKTRNPMNGPKYVPASFIANQKLYVMSRYPSKVLFEVFSPDDETWQVLPMINDQPFGRGVSFVLEQKQTFYYIVADTLLSFNLETHEWTIPPDFFNQDGYTNCDDVHIYPRPPPTCLDKCVSLIGDMAFGYVYDEDSKSYFVSASRTISRGEEELVKPKLAPDHDFLEMLRSSRFTYMTQHPKLYSDYIVALQDLDDKQVLCVVTYGTKLPGENGVDVYTKTSYAALSFFDIPGDFYTSDEEPVQKHNVHASFADEKNAEDGGMVRRYFNAKFRQTAHFVVNSSHLCTQGQLKACFF